MPPHPYTETEESHGRTWRREKNIDSRASSNESSYEQYRAEFAHENGFIVTDRGAHSWVKPLAIVVVPKTIITLWPAILVAANFLS